jgi:hypothetical protein
VQRDPAPLVLAEAAPPAATRGGVVALPAPPPALPSPAPAATAVPMTAAPAPAPAPARRASGAPPAPRDTEAVKHYDFEDDAVEGTIKRPDGDPDTSTIRARHKSLIEIPDNFIAATAKMVEDM